MPNYTDEPYMIVVAYPGDQAPMTFYGGHNRDFAIVEWRRLRHLHHSATVTMIPVLPLMPEVGP